MFHTTSRRRHAARSLALVAGLATLLATLLAGPPEASAALPSVVPVHGLLQTAAGVPAADGKYVLTFRLYDLQDAKKALWSEIHPIVKVQQGMFAARLGAAPQGKPLPVDLFASTKALWLGVQVSDEVELPRVPLNATPYALRALSAAKADAFAGVIKGDQLAPGSVVESAVGFTYAGSKTKGGPAVVAEDLKCTGCVGLSELSITGDLDLGGHGLKAKKIVAADMAGGSIVATTVTASSFVGSGAKLTGIQIPKGLCAKPDEVVKGIDADGKLICTAVKGQELPKDGLGQVSNGLLSNQFIESAASANTPVAIKDNNPVGVFDEIDVPDVGVAKALTVHLEIATSDLAQLTVKLFDPAKVLHVLHDKNGKGKVLATAFPKPSKQVSGDLGKWIGKNPKGKWRLVVVDHKASGVSLDGAVKKWRIDVQTISNKKVQSSGVLLADGGLRLKTANKHPVLCGPAWAGYVYYNLADKALYICNGAEFIAISLANPGTQNSPAVSCKQLKAKGNVPTGAYWVDPNGGDKSDASKTFCEMSIDGGGWTFLASFHAGGTMHWSYYSPKWTDDVTISPDSLDVFGKTLMDRKVKSWSNMPFTEVLVTNHDGSKFHVMHQFKGVSGASYSSMKALHAGGGNWIWANKKTSKGGGMWDYPNWAFKNIEAGSDQCWNARIAVCKQVHVGHTGGGSLVGTACSGGKSGTADLATQTLGSTVYRCLTGGSEPKNLPIETGSYYALFVR